MGSELLVDVLTAGAGIALSLLFAYFPSVSKWYYSDTNINKRGLIATGSTIVAALVIFGLSCSTLFNWVACSTDGALQLTKLVLIAFVANQTAFLASPDGKERIAAQARKAAQG